MVAADPNRYDAWKDGMIMAVAEERLTVPSVQTMVVAVNGNSLPSLLNLLPEAAALNAAIMAVAIVVAVTVVAEEDDVFNSAVINSSVVIPPAYPGRGFL